MFKKVKKLFRYIFGFGFMDDFRAGEEEYIGDFLSFRAEMMRQDFLNRMKRVQDEEDGQQFFD